MADTASGQAVCLGHVFKNAQLLRQALTHRSFGQANNERLEFLGDSVLNCAVAHLLYQKHQQMSEGDMSRLRSNLVRQGCLAALAAQWKVTEHLRLGEGELKTGGLSRPSIMADTLEAVIGAIYLDAGFESALASIERIYNAQPDLLDSGGPQGPAKDAKTQLQELLQGRHLPLPVYHVIATQGAAHQQQFAVSCTLLKPELKVTGQGVSRRAAEQSAAQSAIQTLTAQGLLDPITGQLRDTRKPQRK